MAQAKIYLMPFNRLYPLYLNKVMKKGRTETELKEVIEWQVYPYSEALDQANNPQGAEGSYLDVLRMVNKSMLAKRNETQT